MTPRQKVAVCLLVSAVSLGVVGDILFEGRPLGLNALLFGCAFVAALAILIRIGRIPLHQGRRLMIAPLLVFAALLAWHDSPMLQAANLLAIAGAVSLGALRRTASRVGSADVSDYVVGAASAGAATFAGAAALMQREIPWDGLAAQARSRHAGAVARGFAIGLPLLLVFGALFVAADAVFKSLLVSAVPDVGNLWLHVVIACIIGWLAAGLLRDLLAAREEDRVAAPAIAAVRGPDLRIGSTELAVALGAVNLLFGAFVLVQLRYLFGGQTFVRADVHLTYAEYARHGFFELVVVALLVLPLLLGANALVRRNGQGSVVVRVLSVLLVGLVLVVIASALQRMRLYQREYGLTELRIYTTGLILWAGCVFVWLIATVLRGRPRAFATGAVVLGFVATLALNAINPDALIAKTNLSRPHLDAPYLTSLSDDAVPTLLERLPTLPPPLRAQIATALLERNEPSGGILAWSASRSQARALLARDHAKLVAYATAAARPG